MLDYHYYNHYYYSFVSFSNLRWPISYWSLSDSKSPQVSVFWPISVMLYFVWYPLVSLFASPPIPVARPLVTLPRAAISIGITVTFLLHSVCNSFARSKYLYIFSLSFYFTLWLTGTAESTIQQVPLFFWITYYYDSNYITSCEFFTPALADGLSLESDIQQVTSSRLDSSG